MIDEQTIKTAIIAAPAILFSLTVHEFFHAWTAHKFGDDTAKDLGRLTLNPMAHLDLFGTIALFASGFRFGWAKPVPINPMNLRNPRTADLWISAAGPLSNFGLAIVFSVIWRAMATMRLAAPEPVQMFLMLAVSINVSLAFFNLIPLFPLDGSHIVRNLLPVEFEENFSKLDMIAPIILLALIYFGIIWMVLGPIVHQVVWVLIGIGM